MDKWIRQLQVLVALLAASGGAQATFHLWTMTQLYSNADGSVQFIELKALAAGQQFLSGHTLRSIHGGATQTFAFATDLPGETATSSEPGPYGGGGITSLKSMVIGTQGFAALGIVRPDYVVPNGFLSVFGGTLDYGNGADVWTYPALPTDGLHALFRNGSIGINAPLDFADESGSLPSLPGALSGLWWNAGESGWGVHLTQRSSVVFAAWFTYDGSGKPRWYVASRCAMPPGVDICSGDLYEVSGPTFLGTVFNPSLDTVVAVGTLRIAFQDGNTASMTYSVGSQSRTVGITRQPIGTGTTRPVIDYTDLWWNAAESGWGLAIAQQSSTLFLAWYVYDASGQPTWYVVSNCALAGSGCNGTVYRTTGPALGPSFDPGQVHVTPAGTATLSFSDPNNATLTYTVDGVAGSKAITRQLF